MKGGNNEIIGFSNVFYVRLNMSDVLGVNSSLGDSRPCHFEVAETLTANLLEYAWVIQHHSVLSYPDCWSHPVKLLTEFSQTEDYKSQLASCLSSSVTGDLPSRIHVDSVGDVVRCELPASMEIRCSAPHLHRWNPLTSADFTDYFHDRIKIVSTGVAIYRCSTQLCLIAVIIVLFDVMMVLPSVLCQCWLGVRKSMLSAKIEQ